ncbi:MAG: NnrS family protein [Caldimonas sp.]
MTRVAGNAVFFPAAAAYAVGVLPASLYSMMGSITALPGLVSPAGHAHEMLFGFALAVVAGNQVGPSSMARIGALLGFWVLARVTFLFAPQSIGAAACNAAFAVLLALRIAPRLLAAAKKLRNQALPLVLIAICAAAAAFSAAQRGSLSVAVPLFALLMLFMGGRLLAPAVAGQFYRQGANLEARVQPRIEAALILTLAVATAAQAGPDQPALVLLAAAAFVAAGLLAALRLLRWRLWALQRRPDLLCQAAGYGWVALGLVVYGATLAAGQWQTVALHIIMVAGLGTLTLNVMAMTATLKARQDPARARIPIWATFLIAAATLARVLAGVGVFPLQLLSLAAWCWSGAFAMLLVLLVRMARAASRVRAERARQHRPDQEPADPG